ncbi:translocation/assembly module TamB domain-containing protein [Rhizosphaericola mali]|uniref:Translocation/assembly module TamB n=1 Tax=Rhizosphaericola mali TaxID=2545455 RepID=A0A5P2G3Q8_9BACT|nr:translocation/assembly module TamB domain-containing protein [Rhizosphaericola mali]QES90115.1 translocation/assembly module TamB [Rhizosphaericola mali]
MKKIIRRIAKIIGWVLMSILLLLILISVVIQIPRVQNIIKNKIVSYAESKIKTKVSLAHLHFNLFRGVELDSLYMQDQKKDTLLFVNNFRLHLSVLQLIRSQALISEISLDGVNTHIYRNAPDTVYNFQYIIDAFVGKDTATAVDTTTSTSSFLVDINKVNLSNIRYTFHDDVLGMESKGKIGYANTSLKRFDTKTMNVDIPQFILKNTNISYHQYKPLVIIPVDSSLLLAAKKDTAALKLPLRVGNVILDSIQLNYKDDIGAMLADLNVGNLSVTPGNLDVSKMSFTVDDIQLSKTKAKIEMGKSTATTSTDTSSMFWHFAVNNIGVDSVDFVYNDLTAKPIKKGMDYGHLHFKNVVVKGKEMDFIPSFYQGKITQGSLQEKGGLDLRKLTANFTYGDHGASLGKLFIQTPKSVIRDSVSVKYKSLDDVIANPGNMYLFAHLPKNTIYMGDILNVAPMLEEYMSGYATSTFNINSTVKGYVKDLQVPQLEFSGLHNTNLNVTGYIKGLPDPDKMLFNLNIKSLNTSLEDIKALIPKQYISDSLLHGKGPIHISGVVKGKINDLSIPNLQMRGLKNTSLNMSMYAKGLPDANKAYFNIHIKNLHTTATDIETLAPLGSIPKDLIRIPKSISANGYFTGGMAAMNTNLNINTSNGQAKLVGKLTQNGVYSASIALNDLDLGYIAKMDTTLGKMTLTAHAQGSGLNLNHFNMKKFQSDFNANVVSADIYGYNYQNFTTNGNVVDGILKADAGILDSNIHLSLNTIADLLPKYPAVQLNMQLDTIDLQKLHITADKMIMKGRVMADFTNTDPDNLNGFMTVNQFLYKNDSMSLHLDSMYFLARNKDTAYSQMLFFADSILKLDMHGKYKLTEMASAIQNSVMKYYTIPGYKIQKIQPQEWAINGYILPKKIITDFLPEVKGSDSLIFRSYLRSKDSSFNFGLRAKNINYAPQKLLNYNLWATTMGDSLMMGTGANEILARSFHLYNTGVLAVVKHDTIQTSIGTADSSGKTWYNLTTRLIQGKDSSYTISVVPKGLLLNYVTWESSPDNALIYNPKKGVFAHNFVLSTEGQELKMQSVSDSSNSPLDISFKKFKLATLTNAVNQKGIPIDGDLNGTAQLRNILTKPVFVSDIHADNLVYGKQAIGDLALKVTNGEGEDVYKAQIDLTGNQNDMHLSGNYYEDNQGLDLNLLINKFNLETIKPFSVGYLDSVGGFIGSNIAIKGTVDTPVLNGQLKFDNAFFTPTITGAKLKLSNEVINMDNNGFHFNQLTIQDARNNAFTVDGDLTTKNFMDYGFDLALKANDFMLINTPKAANRFFYGTLAFDTDIKLKGDMESPSVNGSIRVNKETDFSMVMPSDDPEVQSRQGVVVFVDKNKMRVFDSSHVKVLTDSLSNQSQLKGMDINLQIQTDTSARFALVMDERTGDELSISGNADLAFGIDKSGKMSLTGSYNLTKGAYQLTLELIKKKFQIQRGSSIVWTGDPLSAIANITALYNVKTSPVDLMSSQVSGTDLNQYKQSMPFTVDLIMKNNLMTPDISFDITLPQDYLSQYPLVDTKLQEVRSDPSEVNKQVFALLLLGRFVGENPLQSAGDATTVGDMAVQTATGILADQLNKLAGNLIQGVDLNFDLNSSTDYANTSGSGQSRTDLSVGVSKRLFSDRIQVNVGSNFALQGTSTNQQATNIAGDVSVDYRLSKDGRYMLRAYRKNQYEGVIEGQVVRTGVGFIFTFDYDKFKEAFHTAKESRQIRKAERKEKRAAKKDEKDFDKAQ